MNLFESKPIYNLLPHGGNVDYFGKIFSESEANQYFDVLKKSINWQQEIVKIYGKEILLSRKVAWYSELEIPYQYSNSIKIGLPFTTELLEIKAMAENMTESVFNSCLLNFYQSGEQGMGFHSDDEKSIVPNSCIASISFGAERKFVFKHKKTNEQVALILEHGSFLAMKNFTQQNWLHSLPKTKKVRLPRINLTFRNMVV